MAAAGDTLAGIPQDLSKLNTTQVVTIAAAAGIPYVLGGGKWWVGGMTTLAVAMQSPNATRAVTETASGALRGAGTFAAAHVATAARGLDFINDIGTGVSMTDSAYAHAQGFMKDFIAPVGYAFDENYDPNAPGANVKRQEFLHLGKEFVSPEWQKMLGQMQTTRELQIPTLATLPTKAELQAGGRQLKQAQSMVKQADYDLVEEKRLEGKTITPQENQKWVLFKYCSLLYDEYVGPNAKGVKADVVRAAYNGENGKGDIDKLVPLTGKLKDPKWLAMSEEQRTGMLERAQAMIPQLELMGLLKYGAVSVIGLPILLAILGGMTFGVIKKAFGDKESKEAKKISRLNAKDHHDLNRAWYNPTKILSNRYGQLDKKIQNNDVVGVYDKLIGYNVLFGNKELRDLIKKHEKSINIKGNTASGFNELRAMLKPKSTSSRLEIRKTFFTALKNQPELVKAIEKLEGINNTSYDVRTLYRFAKAGQGKRSFTVKTEGGENLTFDINRENTLSSRAKKLAELRKARGIRDTLKLGYVIRDVRGGPVSSGNNNKPKSVKFSFDTDGQAYIQYGNDGVANLNPLWGKKQKVQTLALSAEA